MQEMQHGPDPKKMVHGSRSDGPCQQPASPRLVNVDQAGGNWTIRLVHVIFFRRRGLVGNVEDVAAENAYTYRLNR
ncbi:hypothetical protein V502_00205 [Pseudogymnoascus sp. VKM F-4520 (FW-2644)]|nr:hypothetical protein V502_00205 [Pseudogymnoascus sp. VKM F-4520 (FW-2644)]